MDSEAFVWACSIHLIMPILHVDSIKVAKFDMSVATIQGSHYFLKRGIKLAVSD